MRVHSLALPVVLGAALASAGPAFAGPPLLCHPFDIGGAASLPWDGSSSWYQGQSGYDVSRVVADTDALLTPTTPIVVRMETLRRAVIYASDDAKTASALLDHVMDRVRKADAAGKPDAIAYLDAAYVNEAMREITLLGESAEWRTRAAALRPLVKEDAGYTLVQRTVELMPNDPCVHFAAALISADGHRSAYATHAAKARAGASRDPLLARNISHVS
jgi:hypothetical protein